MELEPTSERMVTDQYRDSPQTYLIYLFHRVAYSFAREHARGKRVLDLGCGSGYGTAHLAEVAESIVGADVSPEAVEYARRHHGEGARFVVLEHETLPFADGAFDCVVCFQVVEHVADPAAFVREIHRVLAPGGRALVATPDRSTRLFPGQKPWNRWHLVEYSSTTLQALLAAVFQHVQVLRMGGRADVIALELRRCAKLKWLTLPLTLPFVPDALRTRGLTLLHRLRNRKPGPDRSATFDFSEEDLEISESASPSVNLVAIATRSSTAMPANGA